MLSKADGSFFDPPIENYRNIYGSSRQPQSKLAENGKPSNNFFKMKRHKQVTLSGAGTAHYTVASDTVVDENTEMSPVYARGSNAGQSESSFNLLQSHHTN